MIYGLNSLVKLNDGSKVPSVNLDNAATTPPFKQVMEEVNKQLQLYGSIGRGTGQKSAHTTEIYNSGRDIIKNFLGANSPDYTVFYCNSTTDGINKLASVLLQEKGIVISTRMEHHANDLPWRDNCIYADVDAKGRLLISDIERLLKQHQVKYVCVTAASNVTGYVNDIYKIARLAHRYGAMIIVDGAQIVSHRAINMLGRRHRPDEAIDFFVFSAHKMYSPFGGGAVVGRKDILDKFIPHFSGGGMVEAVYDNSACYMLSPDRYEAGSPNYPGIVGMIKAIEILQSIGYGYIKRYEQFLMRYTISSLKKIPRVILYGDNVNIADRVGVIPFNIKGIEPKVLAEHLSGNHGISVRHAAFCAHPYVSRLTHQEQNGQEQENCIPPVGMVRASFGIYTNKEDVDCLLRAVSSITTSD